MSEGSQSKQETQASDSQKGVYDRNLLLLVPELVYSTGNVFEHWQLDPRVPEGEKEDLANRKVVQSFLARFMKSRSDNALRGLSSGDEQAIKIKQATQPIVTLEYGGKKNGMKLYLGAQYSYFAALYLGVKPCMSVDELLNLLTRKNELCKDFKTSLLLDHLKLSQPGSEIEPPESHSVVAQELELGSDPEAKQNNSYVLQGERVPKENTVYFWNRKIKPNKFISIVAAFFFGCVVSAGFASYLWQQEISYREEEWEKRWKREGTTSLDSVEYIDKKNEVTPSHLNKILWKAAYDPSMDIKGVLPYFEQLESNPDPIWQARGNYGFATAYLRRGQVENALSHFNTAENLLINTDQKSDLRRVYLSKAECYFYSRDADLMLEMVSKSESLDASTSSSLVNYFKALSFLLSGEIEDAISYAEKSLHISLSEGAKNQTAYYHATLGLLYVSDDKLNDAYRHLRLAMEHANQTNDQALLFQLQGYETLWAERMGLPPVALERGPSQGLLEISVIQRRSFIELAREHF